MTCSRPIRSTSGSRRRLSPTCATTNIYARGAADDKGQMYIHIKAAEALLKTRGSLPVNLKFIIEGEEEVGGGSIDQYVRRNAERLRRRHRARLRHGDVRAGPADAVCRAARTDLYGDRRDRTRRTTCIRASSAALRPIRLPGSADILAGLITPDYHITVPGFYDDVAPPSEEEKTSWARLPFDASSFLEKEVGALALIGEPGFTVLERLWARPTLEVHGIVGGFMGEGAKTVIPARATAKVSMRLVPRQKPAKIIEAFEKEVERLTPRGLRAEVRVLSSGEAVSVDPSHPSIAAAARALSATFNKPTVFIRGGGSIPIVSRFEDSLHAPVVLMGFGLPDDCLHAPNEKFHLPNFFNGIRAVAAFWENLAEGK